MEKLHYSHKKSPFTDLFLFLLLLQFSPLLLLSSSAYTPPDKYFINCGTDSNTTVSGRNFVGDLNSGSFGFSAGKSSNLEDPNPTTHSSPLYQTARIFRHQSPYELDIAENGTYLVRLHFYPFSSPANLADALFNVSAAGLPLLSNFSARNTSNSPAIEEFLLTITVGKFRISFTPSQETSLAFVNAVEVFLAPESFIADDAPHVTLAGSNPNYNGLLSQVLRTIHRINVGGLTLTPDNDTLWRNWKPDDDYLIIPEAAKNSKIYSSRPNYQDGGATVYIAPDHVYRTAKELNIDYTRLSNFFNMSWRFDVSKNARHLVRVHFCDIISPALNVIVFNLYIYSNFSQRINPREIIPLLAAPFYLDFVVDSDNSGFMNITVGPRHDSLNQTAFLNGLEIMEFVEVLSSVEEPNKKHLFLIIGSVVGGVVLICISMVVSCLGLRYRKAKPVETLDWQCMHLYGGGSPNLNLGLKIHFSEIQRATKNFDSKLMIGEGGFGKVYKGTLRNGMKVAVKRSEPGHGQGLPEFQTEITILSNIRHRHLVSLIGYCDERTEMILVYEFMEKGTLREHLYGMNGDSEESSEGFALSWNQRLDICIGSAKGLHYLHTGSDRGIIHRDVKSTNILLDEHYVAKVADFGLSRSGPLDETPVVTDVKGSFGYLDPEYFRCLQLTEKSDVYSFGVVLLEVLCARPAISNSLPREQVNLAEWGMSWQKKEQLEKIIDPLLVGMINPNSLRKFGETAEKCLKEYGVDRPTMCDVLWDLEYALRIQQTAMNREPHDDSTTHASMEFPLLVIRRLPSTSFSIEEDELPIGRDNGSVTTASEIFSELKIDGAR